MNTLRLPTSYKFNSLKKPNTSLSPNNNKVNWVFKRIMLHIIWGVLNILAMFTVYNTITETLWELVFLIGCLIYCASYWLITSVLFDRLIGDEIDALNK
tara:strand:+ start:1838 stop:2134 length:297 start_codon:yes stop_codon:yes gene_type:complete